MLNILSMYTSGSGSYNVHRYMTFIYLHYFVFTLHSDSLYC